MILRFCSACRSEAFSLLNSRSSANWARAIMMAVASDGHGSDDALLIDLPQGVQAIQARKVNIEDDHVWLQLQHGAHHVRTRGGLADDLMAELLFQGVFQKHAYSGVILDNHNSQRSQRGRRWLHDANLLPISVIFASLYCLVRCPRPQR